MASILYVYDYNNLKLMQHDLPGRRFLSIGYLLHLSNSVEDLDDIDDYKINNSVVDITNLIKDGNHFKIFVERYLWALSERFDNIDFCLQSQYVETFVKRFPYFFDEGKLNFDYRNDEDQSNCKAKDNKEYIHSPVDLYVYKNAVTIKELYKENTAISLSNLIDECEGLLLKYDIESINHVLKEKEIQYIDLSSTITTLKMRKDLIFSFEVLLHHISSSENIKYSLKTELVADAMVYFPLLLGSEHNMEEGIDETDCKDQESPLTGISNVNLIADQIAEKLQGHNVFKADFKHNLLKFTFLNSMSERKILSVFLCGDSGIGKTEFAKIASGVMYANEPLIKINFGNYSNEGVLNSLIGSPLGYVGSEEGGELINKISTSKSKIILIDEFERATPSVFNFFYELLEDGKFTDRHGLEHNLSGYIIVFTSNMTQKQYQKSIPNSLKSRFDMVYNFIDLEIEDKHTYIMNTARKLVVKLNEEFDIQVDLQPITPLLYDLVKHKNLRDIKRRIEDIVFTSFFELYKDE